MFIRFISFFIALQSSVWALDCREAQAPSQTSLAVQQMISQAENFRSVEDFLIGLPDEMKSNYTLLADSRSFHASNLENPRVVLSSNDGRVRVSYNTAPNSRGSNAIEVSIWNPETMAFDYKEIKAKTPNTALKANESPLACTTCHGNPPKPNLESPDRLPGAIPFSRNTLVSNSIESGWYKNYLARMDERSPENFRLNILKPNVNLESFQQSELSKPTIQVSSTGSESLTERSYKQSSQLMRCFHAKRLEKRANFEAYKYMLAGLKLGCNPASFMQEWNYQAAENYFNGRIPSFSTPKGTSAQRYEALREQVVQDTASRQLVGQRRAVGRQKVFWLEQFLSQHKVDSEMETNSSLIPEMKINQSSEAQSVASVRLLLEPLGIQVSRFSLSRDPFDYNFGGEFKPDYILDEDVASIMSENTGGLQACEFLAEKNQTALEGLRPKAEKFSMNICQQRERIDARMQDFIQDGTSATKIMIKQQSAKILNDKCVACHQRTSESGTNIGSMVIPFDNIDQMESFLTSDYGRLNELKDIMKDRINRPHGHQGAMPVSFITDMTVDEKAYLSLWLDGVGSNP